jgi:hypothetical protein
MVTMGKEKTKISVVGDERSVGYRCSDETGVGVRMRVAVEEMKERGSGARMKEDERMKG